MNQKIYIAVNKEGTPFMFTDEPKRTETTWTGNFYVNSMLYSQITELVKASGLTFTDDPEMIEFQLK